MAGRACGEDRGRRVVAFVVVRRREVAGSMRAETGTWLARGAGFALGVGLILLLAFLAVRGLDVLLLVFVAVLLGAALEPVVGELRSRFGVGRGLAILIVYAAFFAVVVLVSVFIVPAAVVQLGAAIARLPAFLEQVRTWSSQLRPDVISEGVGSLIDAAQAGLRPGPPPDPGSVVSASIVLASATAALLTLLALVFFWLTERSRLQRYVLAFIPLDRRGGVRDAWNEVELRLGLWVRGQLILMATIGIMTGVAYSILGLPGALLLALIAAIAEVIPIVGPLLGAIPALIVAASISPEVAILTLLVYIALQLIEGNILVPVVMRNAVGLSPFLVLVSLLLGAAAGGILGAIVAVPVVAGLEVVLGRLQDREVPVPIDPAAERTPDEEEREDLEDPPDAPGAARKRAAAKARSAAKSRAASS